VARQWEDDDEEEEEEEEEEVGGKRRRGDADATPPHTRVSDGTSRSSHRQGGRCRAEMFLGRPAARGGGGRGGRGAQGGGECWALQVEAETGGSTGNVFRQQNQMRERLNEVHATEEEEGEGSVDDGDSTQYPA
jgi:hypothetical protein